MIIYVPLDIPKIEPNDWDEWWNVWNKHAGIAHKVRVNHNDDPESSPWHGFDLYRRHDLAKKLHAYEVELAPQVPVVLDLIEQVKQHCIFEPFLIRVIENTIAVSPHSDHKHAGLYEFRSILWNTYPDPVWQFTYGLETRNMMMPPDTNSFYYSDNPVKHGSIFDSNYSKGLLMVYGSLKKDAKDVIDRSLIKYKDIAWTV